MSAVFKKLEGDLAILQQGGTYKQVDVYTRNNGELFAQIGSGFVRLYANGATSKPGMMLDTLVFDKQLHVDRFGRLCVYPDTDRKPVTGDPSYLQIGKD